jgi:predicted MFS family arabinose efflux permease
VSLATQPDDVPAPAGPTGAARGLRSLRHRNFRLVWAGQWARATGLWMQLVATPLLVISIGGSAFDLGVVYALQFGPILLFAPLGGALADRIEKRRWVMILQAISAVQAFAFVFVIATDTVTMAHIFVLATVLGLVNAAEMPTRVSFVAEVVPDEDLPNAVALMMVAMNASRIIGPAAAGLLAAFFGFSSNFLWSAIAAVVTIVTFAAIDDQRTRPAPKPTGESVRAALLDGIQYIRRTPAVSIPMLLLGMFGVFGISFQTILPVYAIDVLGVNTSTYGFLLAAMGFGALAAALPMTLVTVSRARQIMLLAPLAFALFLAVLAVTRSVPLAFLVITPLGFFFVLINSSVNVTVQGTIPHEYRGRTMGIYVSIMHGGGAVGALVMGSLAEIIGVTAAMLVGAAATAGITIALRARAAAIRAAEAARAGPAPDRTAVKQRPIA